MQITRVACYYFATQRSSLIFINCPWVDEDVKPFHRVMYYEYYLLSSIYCYYHYCYYYYYYYHYYYYYYYHFVFQNELIRSLTYADMYAECLVAIIWVSVRLIGKVFSQLLFQSSVGKTYPFVLLHSKWQNGYDICHNERLLFLYSRSGN